MAVIGVEQMQIGSDKYSFSKIRKKGLLFILKKIFHWLFSLLKYCNSVWAQQTHTHFKCGIHKLRHSSVWPCSHDRTGGGTTADWAQRTHYNGRKHTWTVTCSEAAAHLVTEGCQVWWRLLPDGPDLSGRHQSKDVLDASGRVVPELIPEGIVSGLHRLKKAGTARKIKHWRNVTL